MESATNITAQLVLASGSRAGLVAPIHPGYYLIGRLKECQIRPKSRSVSRRHCLVHWHEGVLRVFDLESTSGTKINGDKILPRMWTEVTDGDELRCGKIAFRLQIAAVTEAAGDHDSPVTGSSMLQGSAWQEDDVAAFLGAADDVDRERRYDSIRAKQPRDAEESGIFDDDDLVDVETDSSADSTWVADPSAEATLDSSDDDGAEGGPTGSVTDSQKQARQRHAADKTKAARTRVSATGTRDLSSLKLILAGVLVVLVVFFFAYQIYHFRAGPPTPIVDGID